MDDGWVSRRHQSIELAALGAALLVGGAKLSGMHALMSRWTDVAGVLVLVLVLERALLELSTLSLVQAAQREDAESSHGCACTATRAGGVEFGVRCTVEGCGWRSGVCWRLGGRPEAVPATVVNKVRGCCNNLGAGREPFGIF